MWTGPGGTGGDLILEGFLHLGAKSQQKLQPPQSGIRRGFLSKRGFKMLVWSLESSRVTPDPAPARVSPRRGRRCDLRRCTMTPMISTAPTSTTASTEKLAMAASFHTSGVSSTYLPADCTEMRSAPPRSHSGWRGRGWGLTGVAVGRLGVLLARLAGHADVQVRAPELRAAALTCGRRTIRLSEFGTSRREKNREVFPQRRN